MLTRQVINTKLRIGEMIHIALYQGLKEGACYDFEKSRWVLLKPPERF